MTCDPATLYTVDGYGSEGSLAYRKLQQSMRYLDMRALPMRTSYGVWSCIELFVKFFVGMCDCKMQREGAIWWHDTKTMRCREKR